MGAKVRPVNFKGKKGRSGRMTKYNEESKHEAIKKAWAKVNLELDNNPVDKVALPIALRDMTEKTENTLIIPKPIDDVLQNDGLQKNKTTKQKNKNNPGRNVGLEDSIDNLIPDSNGAVGQKPNSNQHSIGELPSS